MRGNSLLIILAGLFIFSACSNFGGIASNSKTYTTDYNFPVLKTVPYNDPTVENRAPAKKEVQICKGRTDSTGFKCN